MKCVQNNRSLQKLYWTKNTIENPVIQMRTPNATTYAEPVIPQ